jgi:signal transduction histidine kinase
MKPAKTSLQFKLALMFFLVMLVSAVISLSVLVLTIRPVLKNNTQNQVLNLVASMKQLEMRESEMDNPFTTDEIISLFSTDSFDIVKLEPKSGEYYRVKIEAAEYNCYVEESGFFPTAVGYTVLNGDYLKIMPTAKDNAYWMAAFVVMIAMIVSIIIGSIMTIFVSRRVLKPIRDLSSATTRVARGDFAVEVPLSKDPEYNTLIKNFNKMAEELSGIETLRGDFISNVSHEFKTPLASIQGFAKLLQDDTISEEERRDYTQIIISETGRLSSLTSDILKLSKLENQNTIVNKTRFSLDEQIRKIMLVLEPEWERKNIELDISLDDVSYFGNEELMAQIWQNVINNAIKFTPVGGHIGIRLFRTDKNITARISDNGASIPPEIADHIFDKFYQGDNSRKTEGNGLGLALVKRIVDLCGGKIRVENVYEGGVCFVIELPYVIENM